jgi:glycolate oxidase
LHPNILFDAREPGAYERVREVGAEILKLCVDAGGTISGEHGIGVEKLQFMPWLFNQDDLAAQKKLRTAIAPSLIFNPCKMIPEGSHCGEIARKNLSAGVAVSDDLWI